VPLPSLWLTGLSPRLQYCIQLYCIIVHRFQVTSVFQSTLLHLKHNIRSETPSPAPCAVLGIIRIF
jgi:hypothetical protein